MEVVLLKNADRAATNLGEEELRYRLDLQFFASEGEDQGDGGQTAPTDEEVSKPSNEPSTGGQESNNKPSRNNPPVNDSNDDDDEKPIPQWKVNKIVTREVRKAQEDLLRQLGIEDFESAKEGLQKFREWQDAQKSREEKQLEQFKKAEQQLKEFQTENAKLKAQIAALKAGVKSDSLEDVIVLANNLVDEDTSIDEAIQKVLKKYPQFKQTTESDEGEGEKKPKFSSGNHQKQPQSEAEKWINIFKQI